MHDPNSTKSFMNRSRVLENSDNNSTDFIYGNRPPQASQYLAFSDMQASRKPYLTRSDVLALNHLLAEADPEQKKPSSPSVGLHDNCEDQRVIELLNDINNANST